MKIETTYTIGDIVYLKTDSDQQERMIIGIDLRPRSILYLLAFGSETSNHYEIELTYEKSVKNLF